MRPIKRGCIVWLDDTVSFELGDNVQSIERPYVVISNNSNNRLCPTINIACLTKQESKSNYPMHVVIDKTKYDLEYNSVIYLEQILTVNKNKIEEVVCVLDKEDLKRLNKAIYVQLINENDKSYCG